MVLVQVLGNTVRVRLAVRVLAAATLVVALALAGPAASVFAASSAWNVQRVGGPVSDGGVVIAVVDTGVDANHPAFGGRVLPQINIAGGSGDDNGHGTHVAGTAAGGTIDCGAGPQAVGVAPGAKILPVRVLDNEGRGSIAGVAEGIERAADAGAATINLSLGPELNLLGGSGDTSELTAAIEYAWSKGSIPVLAAGNDGSNLLRLLYPAGYGNIPAVVVTATTADDQRASYADSVGNARWALAAPGGDSSSQSRQVMSAYPGNKCLFTQGTSMAAPHVSGALALLRARGLSPQQAIDRLLSTATPLSSSGTGRGLLNLNRALQGLTAPGTSAPQTTAAPATSAAPPATTAPPTTRRATTSTAPSSTVTSPAPTTSESTTTGPEAPDTLAASAPADLSVTTDDGGAVGAPLAVGAGLVCAGAWLACGRAAFRLRR